MYRYASRTNHFMYALGVVGALATGSTVPFNSLIFGDLANSMIDFAFNTANGTSQADIDALMEGVATYAFKSTLMGVVMLVCSYISVTLFNYAAQDQIFRLRGKFLRSVLHQDMSWFDFNQSGEVASRMNECVLGTYFTPLCETLMKILQYFSHFVSRDLTKMEDGLGEKVVMFLHFLAAFGGCIIFAFIKGWQLALVCLSSLPVTFIAMGLVGVVCNLGNLLVSLLTHFGCFSSSLQVTARLSKQELSIYADAGVIAAEAISGIRTVKAFEGEHRESKAYKDKIIDARKINIKRNLFSGLGFGLLWFFIYSSYALAFWYGVGLVLKNYAGDEYYSNYDPGTMMAVFFSVMMGSMNLGMASPYIEAFGIAKGACAKVFNLIEKEPAINPIKTVGHNLNQPLTVMEFKDVDFYYPTRERMKVLDKLNLKIKRGQTVALVGSSGCGKSTCIQLIQRFYDPQGGAIHFNEVNLKDININWLRERIGVVGQEPILFGTTIYENIRYGREDATREEIEAAARAANALRFINKLPRGLYTMVGERGAQLSGGQKQRIAIARALVRNPEILLLDEATSALDTASEVKVQKALEKARKGRTTIIVAHRLSTIRRADCIVVILKGQVVESGTHDELMDLKRHYYNLITNQVGEVEAIPSTDVMEENELLNNAHDEDEEQIKFPRGNDDDDGIEVKENKGKKYLWPILKMNRNEWPQILCGCLTSVIMGSAMPLFALLFGSILQILSVRDDPDYVRDNTNIYSLYFVLSGIAVGAATFLQIYSFGFAGEKLTERLRGLMFEAILKMEIAWFDKSSNGTGSLCSRLSGDAAAVQGATGQRIGTVIQALATISLGIGISMYFEWSLGLLALAFAPFILVATFLQRKVMIQEHMGTAKAMEKCTKLAVEVVSNIRTVVSLGREEMFYRLYMEMLGPAVKKSKRNTHYRGFVYGLARSLMYFAYAACMYYGGWCVIHKGMAFGDVFIVAQSLIMGTVSIASALAFAPNFQKGLTAAENICKLLTRSPEIVDHADVDTAPWYAEGNVAFETVRFSYPTRPEILVLRDLTLSVAKGERIALVGQSGCGKSTCIQLLQRFYDVDAGSITIDDKDLRSLSLQNIRRQMGIVSQEPILFDRTISENIAYGDNNRLVSQAEIIEAAKKANIHDFIVSLPLGYENRIGEKGTQMSGGQKQRIAIARALIRNPRVLLLDEATSALDAESESLVQAALDVASEGRTTITIAHRLSTIIDSDVIFVFKDGQISEQGTHRQLLELQGLYFSLYKLQSGSM
uniref:ABC-type xenobiotic transporter n=1 Tax=Glossina austeni TaxID=7395 RepID=A0A1A9V7P2_GLOAU